MRSALSAGVRRAARAVVALLSAAVLVACAATAVSGCGGDQSAEARIGEVASNTKVELTVHSVKVLGEITMEDGAIATVRDDGVYVLVDMTVKNLQDTGHYVDLDDLGLTIDGTSYAADEGMPGDAQAPAEFKPLRTGNLKSGKKTRGMVLFLMPQGALDSLTYVAEPEDIVVGLEGMKAKAPQEKKAPRVGQTARGGGLSMVVRSVSYPSRLVYQKPGSSVVATLSPRSGNRLVVVDLTLENRDREPRYEIDPLAVSVTDSKGENWVPFNRQQDAMAESDQLPVKSLRPGMQTGGKVVISIPANRKVKRVSYAVGVLGPPLEVRVGG